MKAQPPIARRIGIALLAVCATALTSCAAGQYAQTAYQTPAIDGLAKAKVGSLELRGVAVLTPPNGISYAEGDDAQVTLAIVNVGQTDDTLTSVSTPAADGYTIEAQASGAASDSAAPSSTASSGAAPSGSASGASSIAIPPGQSVTFSSPVADNKLVLTGLKQKVFPGTSIQITFTFAKAGAITATVPVQLSEDTGSSTIPAETGSAGGAEG